MDKNTLCAIDGKMYLNVSTREHEAYDDDEDLNEYGRHCKELLRQAIEEDKVFRAEMAALKAEKENTDEKYTRRYNSDDKFREEEEIKELDEEFKFLKRRN